MKVPSAVAVRARNSRAAQAGAAGGECVEGQAAWCVICYFGAWPLLHKYRQRDLLRAYGQFWCRMTTACGNIDAVHFKPMSTQTELVASAITPETGWHPSSLCTPAIADQKVFSTPRGVLFNGDCLEILPFIEDDSIDTVFADPPFNLAKEYGARVNDDIPEREYVAWCKAWLVHCERVLKPGGALFIYNLPKWNVLIGSFLTDEGEVMQ
jgi:hypothetical protein